MPPRFVSTTKTIWTNDVFFDGQRVAKKRRHDDDDDDDDENDHRMMMMSSFDTMRSRGDTRIRRHRLFTRAASEQGGVERRADVKRGERAVQSGRHRRRHERDADFNRFDVGLYSAENTRDGDYGWA